MAEYIIDKIAYGGNVYKLQDNQSGYITGYTETDPVFSASPAAGISATDISNWNGKSNTDEKVKQNSINSSFNAEKNILLGNSLDSSLSDNSDINTTFKATWLTYKSGGGSGPYLRIKNPSNASDNYISLGYNGIIWRRDGYESILESNTLTSHRVLSLPDKNGTVALTSDIPSISLNGSSTTSASFYAPTTAGASGQVLTSNGSGAPVWAAATGGSSTQIIRWTEE